MQYKDLSESEQQSDSDGLHVKMGHTLFCVLSLFLLSALIHGNAEEPVSKATLTADKTTIPVGGSVTLSCSVDGSDGWTFYLYRRISDSSQPQTMNNNQTWSGIINVSEGGLYYCRGGRGDQLIFTSNSSELRIEETVSSSLIYGNTEAVSASLTLHQNWNQIFSGESITLTCDIQGGGGTEWTYEWTPAKLNTRPTQNKHVIDRATESDSGNYRCRGKKDFSFTEWSNVLTLTISADKPKPTLTADKKTIRAGERVTLTCSVDRWDGWTFYWYRRLSDSSGREDMNNNGPWDRVRVISEVGLYSCRGGRGDPLFITEFSNEVRIEKIVPTKVTVSRRPSWSHIYSGEKITVTCQIEGGTEWTYEWKQISYNRPGQHNTYVISRATESDSGNYRCRGKKYFSFTEWSNVLTLTISATKPQAELTPDNREVPVGGSVTLTCSVKTSSGWTYYWYRDDKSSEPLTKQDAVSYSSGRISVSQEGLYWCRGGRGNPVYYTEYSQSVIVYRTVPNRATVTLHPNWTKIYSGETVAVRCEIQGGGDEWEYEWETPTSNKASHQTEFRISSVSSSHSGNYRCKGRMNNAKHNTTEWSDSIKLTVYHNKPRPVLTVSPSWLSPGASVTLNCEVEHPSAGWRFYWYKTVPDLSDKYYRYELLPGRDNGTEQNSSIIHGQTHTAGYVCRAGRGDPVYYTDHSEPKFVWSGDVHPSASLTVNPDRVQHFTSDSVSLSCEGNSTKWRVMRFPDGGFLSHCYHWGTMTGSTCKISTSQSGTAVYWCESGSGEFSNSVNITVHNTDIIPVSPVHPVTEGESVTVGCKLRSKNFVSSVFFYQNDKLRQNDTRQELNISAVSKSDEGFYKCQYSGKESSQSWLTVKGSRPESSSFTVPFVTGLITRILLIVFLQLLLLLCCCRKIKSPCSNRFIQSLNISPDSATKQTVDQSQTQVYSSLLHGDAAVYEAIRGSGNTESDGQTDEYHNVTLIQCEALDKTGRPDDAEENCDYNNVNPDPTTGS